MRVPSLHHTLGIAFSLALPASASLAQLQYPYLSPYQAQPYQAQPHQALPKQGQALPAPSVAPGVISINAASQVQQGVPAQSYTIWVPRQVQLQYQPQTVTVPQWQLQPVEVKQPYSYMAPHYRQVTYVTYRPRLVLDPVEQKVWQVEWQRKDAERRVQVWQPQMGQQQLQTWQPQWQFAPDAGQ